MTVMSIEQDSALTDDMELKLEETDRAAAVPISGAPLNKAHLFTMPGSSVT